MFDKLGYDENLTSLKSRVFVVTLHSEEPITVKVGDAAQTDLNEKTSDLVLDHIIKTKGVGPKRVNRDDYLMFRVDHPGCYGASYGVINKTEEPLTFKLDMTESTDAFFTPPSGEIIKEIPPNSLRYIGATVSDPNADQINFAYRFAQQ